MKAQQGRFALCKTADDEEITVMSGDQEDIGSRSISARLPVITVLHSVVVLAVLIAFFGETPVLAQGESKPHYAAINAPALLVGYVGLEGERVLHKAITVGAAITYWHDDG